MTTICPHCHNEITDAVTLVTVRGQKQSLVGSGVLVKRYAHGSRAGRKIEETPIVYVTDQPQPLQLPIPVELPKASVTK